MKLSLKNQCYKSVIASRVNFKVPPTELSIATVVKRCGLLNQKSNAMGYKSRLRQILQNQIGYTDFRKILIDTLILEERINNSGSQSIYFRWGLSLHRKKLFVMKNYFEMYRGQVNASSIESLQNELEAGVKFLEHCLPHFPPEMDEMLRKKAEAKILQLKDFIRIKEIAGFLPTVSELEKSPDLLVKIIG